MDSKKTGGIICTIIGAIGALYGIFTILSDIYTYNNSWFGGYNYESPLTDHEKNMILIFVGGLILLLIGFVLWVTAASQEKNTQTYTNAPMVDPAVSSPTESKSPKQEDKKTDAINEVMLYRELLDSGVITQEEFDAKKKQLLEL